MNISNPNAETTRQSRNVSNPYTELTQQSREELVLEHAPLIKRIVTRMAARFPPGVDQDELIQAGMLGLLDAMEKYDASKDVQFKTYAEFRIKGAILDELREMDWVPRSVRAKGNEWESAWRAKSSELGRDPSDQEMASQMKMPLKEYHRFISQANPIPLISSEEFKTHTGEEEAVNLLEILADPESKDPFSLVSMQQMQNKLADTILKLTEQEQLVLSLYYEEELNLKEIAQVLGVVESRVSQIRTKAILKLRAMLKEVISD